MCCVHHMYVWYLLDIQFHEYNEAAQLIDTIKINTFNNQRCLSLYRKHTTCHINFNEILFKYVVWVIHFIIELQPIHFYCVVLLLADLPIYDIWRVANFFMTWGQSNDYIYNIFLFFHCYLRRRNQHPYQIENNGNPFIKHFISMNI